LLLDELLGDLVGLQRSVGKTPREQLVEDEPEREDVRPRVRRLAEPQLGSGFDPERIRW